VLHSSASGTQVSGDRVSGYLPGNPAYSIPQATAPTMNPEQLAEIARLTRENQQLTQQVQRLVRVERSMIEFQDHLDLQVNRYRQLNQIAQRLKSTFDPKEILTIAMEFMLYDLNFERCLIFRHDLQGEFSAFCWDGYEEAEPEEAEPTGIKLSDTQTQFILQSTDLVLHDDTASKFPELSQQIGMDEFALLPIRSSQQNLRYLVALGNTRDRAKLFTRISQETDYGVVLSNLLAQLSAAIGQAELYQETRHQAETLQITLQKLQSTQTQLIQTEKMSSLGQLIAGIAHEINNPVNFIHGNLTYAQTYTLDLLRLVADYQRAYPEPDNLIQTTLEEIDFEFLRRDLPQVIASMHMGASRIQEIVLSLRNFSRLDESEFKAVQIQEGIESTLLILQHRFKTTLDRPMIQLIKDYSDLPYIECAAGLLNQVFMNLISNAIDALETACQEGLIQQPCITLKTAIEETGVSISVIDNGPGISDKIRHRLFDPFFTTKPVGKGTGLGLSISYQIITEKHGGRLECFSTVGQGTEFRIWLPRSVIAV
jgi:signal transduction histidine kinase